MDKGSRRPARRENGRRAVAGAGASPARRPRHAARSDRLSAPPPPRAAARTARPPAPPPTAPPAPQHEGEGSCRRLSLRCHARADEGKQGQEAPQPGSQRLVPEVPLEGGGRSRKGVVGGRGAVVAAGNGKAMP